MANSKISALTSASTPLAGTETLPIVQSGATVKVATNDLTVRNIRAAATTGILQVSGPTAGTTRTATVPDANWTAARTDAAQSFTGDQTLSTGNLVVSNGKGIDFSATAGAGTSELLDDYEEGTWTPVITCATPGDLNVVYGNQFGEYTKVGNLVTIACYISTTTFTHTTASGGTRITGLPFAPKGTPAAMFGPCTVIKATFNANYFFPSAQISGTFNALFLTQSSNVSTSSPIGLPITSFVSGARAIVGISMSYYA